MGYRTYANTNGFIVAANGTGDFTTITAAINAINAASPAIVEPTLFLTDPLYTENFTLPANTHLAAFVGSEENPSVAINGTVTISATGSATISGIELQAQSNYALIVSDSGIINVTLENCNLLANGFDVISFTNTNAASSISLNTNQGNLSAAGLRYYTMTSPGLLHIQQGYYTNTGNSITPSNNSAGEVRIFGSEIQSSLLSSGTGAITTRGASRFITSNLTAITIGGSGESFIQFTQFNTGTAPCVSVSTSAGFFVCFFTTSNYMIAGAGGIAYSDLTTNGALFFDPLLAILGTGTLIGQLILQDPNTNHMTLDTGSLLYGNSGTGLKALPIGSNGDVLQLKSGLPAWSTPTFPITVGGAGTILRSDGTNWAATTATYPLTTTINQLLYSSSANTISGLATANSSVLVTSAGGVPSLSGTLPFTVPVTTGGTGATTLTGVLTGNGTSAITASSVTQYALLVGGASNAVGSIADVAVNQVLVSGGVSANPAYTAYPQISGLGIGASPGSTAGITFDATNFFNAYQVSTFTPTLDGAVSGTTTYTLQSGQYIKIGKLVFINIQVQISAATGTGDLIIGGLPFTIQTVNSILGSAAVNAGLNTFPAGTTNTNALGILNTSTIKIACTGSGVGQSNLQMVNQSGTFRVSLTYIATS